MSTSGEPIRVLYLVYWGAAEPLGRSLVVPSVERLSRAGVDVRLITFEKASDLAQPDGMAELRARLAAAHVGWRPLRYHKRPKWPATAFDVVAGAGAGVASGLRRRVDVVHARTFTAGPIGLAVSRVLRARFVFHNEGFYPDEQVDAGVWREGGLPHRLTAAVERRLYASADAIVTLSERARAAVLALPQPARERPVVVAPSAVDLERFRPATRPAWSPGEELRLAYVGNAGGRYPLDTMARFVAVLKRRVTRLRFVVLSQTDASDVRRLLSAGGVDPAHAEIGRVSHEAVPERLRDCHVGLSLRKVGLSGLACSPTKTGEYWASGLALVTSAGVGDNADVVERERVGVVVADDSTQALERAADALLALLQDAGLPARCRRAAETHYDLGAAVERQLAAYRRILEGVRA